MYTRSTPSLSSAYMMIICIVSLEIKDQSISSGRHSTFRFRSHMVVNPKDRVFFTRLKYSLDFDGSRLSTFCKAAIFIKCNKRNVYLV